MRKSTFIIAIVFAVAIFALGANQASANGGHYHYRHYYGGYPHPQFYSGSYGSWYAAPSVVVVPACPVSPAVVVPAPVVVRPWYRCYR